MLQSKRRPLFLTVLVTLVTVLYFWSTPVSYADGPDLLDDLMDQVVRTVLLTPSSDADVRLNKVEAAVLEDGSIYVRAEGEHQVGAPPLAYNIEVDFEEGTYTTVQVDPTPLPPLGEVVSALRAVLRVRTVDPVNIIVAETTNVLDWDIRNGTVVPVAFNGTCWAANPTPLNTHWFTNWCANPRPFVENNIAYHQAAGAYHNWDFGNPNQQTTTNHSSLIGGRNNNTWTHTVACSSGGDSAWLLRCQVQVN